MAFKIASSGDFQNPQFWCTSNFDTRLGGSLKRASKVKPMFFKVAMSGDVGAPAILVSISNVLRSLIDRPLELHLYVTTDLRDQSFCNHDCDCDLRTG